MPKHLKKAIGETIPVASQYTCGQIAFLMQVSHRTAAKMIDNGTIKGFRMMSARLPDKRERRVLHSSLIAFIKWCPDYHFMLSRLENYDPAADFGKDHLKLWNKTGRKKPRVKIQQELDSSALGLGLEHESSEPETESI